MIPNVLSTFLEENLVHNEKEKKGLRCSLRMHKWIGRDSVCYNPFPNEALIMRRNRNKLSWTECTRCYKKKRCPDCKSLHLYVDYDGSEGCNDCSWIVIRGGYM